MPFCRVIARPWDSQSVNNGIMPIRSAATMIDAAMIFIGFLHCDVEYQRHSHTIWL